MSIYLNQNNNVNIFKSKQECQYIFKSKQECQHIKIKTRMSIYILQTGERVGTCSHKSIDLFCSVIDSVKLITID